MAAEPGRESSPGREPPHSLWVKRMWFCPECDHRSPADGDWERVRAADGFRYRCPECATTVTRRPADRTTASPTGAD